MGGKFGQCGWRGTRGRGGGGQGDGTGEGDKGMGQGGGGRGLAQGEQLSCIKTETVMFTDHLLEFDRTFHKQIRKIN